MLHVYYIITFDFPSLARRYTLYEDDGLLPVEVTHEIAQLIFDVEHCFSSAKLP